MAKPAASAKSGSKAAPPKPSLRFHHSAALRAKTLAVLGSVEKAKDPAVQRDALANLVVDLTAAGMDAYFKEPLEATGAGFLVRQSASLGIAGATQMIGSAIRNIVGRMDGPQLLSVCASIRQFMR